MTVTIHPMVVADAPRVGRMHHQAWVDSYGAFLPADYFETRWTVADAVQLWQGILRGAAEPGVARLLAEEAPAPEAAAHTTVEGFVVAGPSRDVDGRPTAVRRAELRGLYVTAAQLGSGLGQRLLDDALPDGQPAELWVFERNVRARAFYQRNGFRTDGAEFTDERFPELLEVRMVR
jgi:GNAT superfamily N-acetyltransferase